MGSITTGVGLISGINTAQLIEQLLAIEARPKTNLEGRVSVLEAQRTALLDINARLLNLKNTSGSFRLDRIFKAVQSLSSNEEVLTASADKGTQPGSYQFIVKQLVQNSQRLSKGFTDRDITPLGLDSMTFEFGNGKLAVDRSLEDLNGGLGVDRGRITITDRSGASATVDLTDVTSVNEVLDRINETSGISVTATVTSDGFVVTDTSGGGGSLTIADAASDTTATDLGIAGTDAGGVITGTDVFFISGSTQLSSLNDGNGVAIREGVYDLLIQSKGPRGFLIDLGPIRSDIDDDTALDDLNNGDGITIDDDSDEPDLKITDRDGTEYDVDLTGVTTVGQLRTRISSETGGAVTLAVVDGDHFVLTDTTGGSGLFRVDGAGPNGDDAAEDLGLLEEDGVAANTITGTTILNSIDTPQVQTIQDVIDRINNAEDTNDVANGGDIVASIGADGKSLVITDNSGGGQNLLIRSGPGLNPWEGGTGGAAADLGIATIESGSVPAIHQGSQIIGGLNSILINNINGGDGIDDVPGLSGTLTVDTPLSVLFNGAGISTNGDANSPDIRIRDRLNNTFDIELDGLTTVQDLIDTIDSETGGNVTLGINGQALEATHNPGGVLNFQISDINGSTAAADLGIVADYSLLDGDVVTGVDTQPSDSSVLIVNNRDGVQTSIDLTGVVTLDDVLDAINTSGAGVTATLNSNGTGLQITDTTGGSQNLQIFGGGAAALGIDADVASDDVTGTNLQRRYVDEATLLSELNYGRGIGLGSFRITDGFGETATITINDTIKTVDKLLQTINAQGLAITARINDNGDGIIIEEDLSAATSDPFVKIKVETVNGGVASALGILGEAESVVGGFIDGSYEKVVDLDTNDDLNEVVSKINDSGFPVSAAIINTGSGTTPYRISFSSEIGGLAGDLIIDTGGVDLGLTTLVKAQDAKVFFGSQNPGRRVPDYQWFEHDRRCRGRTDAQPAGHQR